MEKISPHNRDADIMQGTFLNSGGSRGCDEAHSVLFGNFVVVLQEV